MTEPELKPLDCPCCGCCAAIIYNYKNFERKSFVILCQNENCLLQTPQYENMNQAVDSWNKREGISMECWNLSQRYKKAIEFIKNISDTVCVSTANHFYLIDNATELLRELGELND